MVGGRKIQNRIRSIVGNWQIITIIILFISLRLIYLFTRNDMPIWDEAVYVGMGKYIYSAGISGLWESIRPIALPMITGALWYARLDVLFYSAIIEIIFGAALICTVYMLALKLFNKGTAVIAAFLLAITHVFFHNASTIMTDIPSTLFATLALYFFAEDKKSLSGICAGLGFMFKFPQALTGVAIVLAIAYASFSSLVGNQKKSGRHNRIKGTHSPVYNIAIFAFGVLIIALPFLIFNYISYNAYSNNFFDAAFKPVLSGSAHQGNPAEKASVVGIDSHVYNMLFYPIMIFQNNIILLLTFVAIGYFFTKSLFKDKNKTALFISLVLYTSYLTFITNKQDRFLIMILPILCILSAYVITEIYKKSRRLYVYKIFTYVILIFLSISLIYSVEQEKSEYDDALPSGSRPVIVDELYRYFENNDVGTTILTTDPIFAVYSDKRFIPIYDTMQEDTTFVNYWEKDMKHDASVFSRAPFKCQDEACSKRIDELYSYAKQDSVQAFTKIYDNMYSKDPVLIFIHIR